MSRGAGGFHPFTQPMAEAVGVRWSERVGYDREALLAIAIRGDRVGLVLAANDSDGDSTAVGLTPADAESLRDALTEWLDEQ